ncbi:hypothetical protein ACFY7C_06165 [Streptomyces sp. NPDC012769]|uniref:hypothetical protein n=1 Tax=Streptomyces sp. NPDC012769 TaxID=3364848 RepID=UPI0036ABD1FB
MADTEKIDQDAVLRARVLLLGSGRLSTWECVGAYRVLARVSPRAYLPRLMDALLGRGYELDDPEVRVRLFAEAVDAARRIEGDARPGRLARALGAYERALFAAGRRAEGRAVCEESAGAGAYGRLALVLAEEGRHAEAAALYGRHVGREGADASEWSLIEWAAELDAAGRREEALEVFARLVADRRRGAREDRAPLASLVWMVAHHAGMLLAAGRPAEAAEARREALTVLTRLASEGEPVSWSNIQAWWVTLFVLSGRPDEPAATADAPMPPFGAYVVHGWSPDTRESYVASIPSFEREVAALRASGDLRGLVTVQRRLTLRRALRWETEGRRAEETLRPVLDEGVALARRLPGDEPSALARALTDRALFLLAVKRYADARRDFAEAVALQDGPARPVSPISHPTSQK